MALEKKPKKIVPADYVPFGSFPYAVRDADNWWAVASRFKVDVHYLIWFNFRTNVPEEVNWYLRERVGCTRTTADGKNFVFCGADRKKGVIHIPLNTVV
jgi:hypothetical protein